MRHEQALGRNHRLAMPYRQLAKMSEAERAAIAQQAKDTRARLDRL